MTALQMGVTFSRIINKCEMKYFIVLIIFKQPGNIPSKQFFYISKRKKNEDG